jgi:hypothetical protein
MMTAVGWLYCFVELIHWSNAYLISSHNDFLGYGHEAIDITIHTLLQVIFFGMITCKMNNKQLMVMGFLRFSLELVYMVFEEEVYGRRLPPTSITIDLPGTLAYVLAELFITLVASLVFKTKHNRKHEKNNEVVGDNMFILSLKTNKDNIVLVMLYHWAYIIAADFYLKSKEMSLFHGAHMMNLILVPVILPILKLFQPRDRIKKV